MQDLSQGSAAVLHMVLIDMGAVLCLLSMSATCTSGSSAELGHRGAGMVYSTFKVSLAYGKERQGSCIELEATGPQCISDTVANPDLQARRASVSA